MMGCLFQGAKVVALQLPVQNLQGGVQACLSRAHEMIDRLGQGAQVVALQLPVQNLH